jgi:flagellin-like hook-associated protein FlgL
MVLGSVGFRTDVSESSIIASVNDNIDKYLAGEIGNPATNSMTFSNSDGRGSIEVSYTYDLSYFDTLTDPDGNRREPTDTERNDFIYNGITRPLNNWYVLEVDAGGQSTVHFTAAANGMDLGNTNNKLVTYSYDKAKRNVHIQSGHKENQSILLQFDVINTGALGINNLSVLSQEKAGHAISASQNALEKISDSRSKIGAYQNQLEHAYNISLNTAENTEYSESRIRDMDIAGGIVEYSKNQILLQAGQAVIAQSNQSKEGILKLLE